MTPKSLLAALAGVLLQASSALGASAPKYLITFGDSYSQTWFDIHGEAPSAANPIGNPPFPGWTASGGVNWVGSLTAEFNNSLTLSYNFAYGGATVDSEIVPPYADTVISMEGQVDIFLDFIHNQSDNVPWTTSNALVGVWMGVNDVGNSFNLANADDLVKRTVARYFELLQKVYDAGIRKFVLLSVPPTNLTPLMLQQDAESSARLVSSIKLYNKLVSAGFKAFQKRNRHITGKIVDTSLAFNKAIKNPTKYGAPNATCYNEDGLSCLWFNDYHPGITIERLVASDVAVEVNSRKFSW